MLQLVALVARLKIEDARCTIIRSSTQELPVWAERRTPDFVSVLKAVELLPTLQIIDQGQASIGSRTKQVSKRVQVG